MQNGRKSMPYIAPFVVYVICSDVLYGLLHVILKNKFSHINTLTLMCVYVPVVLVSVYILRYFTKTNNPSFDVPQGGLFWLLMAVGLIFVAADYCFIAAYTHGGDLMTVTALALLTPVFASVISYGASLVVSGITFTPPNLTLLAGYVLTASGVWLVMKGSVIP